MATNSYTATNGNGVTYALTYIPAAGITPASYKLTTTDPNGTITTLSNISPNNVLTGSGTLTTASVAGNSIYVVPPGVTASINSVANLLGTTTIYVAGTAVFSGLANVAGGTIVTVDGGSFSLASSVVANALSGTAINLENGAVFGNGAGLLSALAGSTINYMTGGGLFDVSAGGTAINLSNTTITGFNAATDKLEFDGLVTPVDHYAITDTGIGSQAIALFSSTGVTIGTVTLAGTSLATGTVLQGQSGPLTVVGSGTSIVIDPVRSVLVCFLSGTRIRTPGGEAAVETLAVGDLVLTADGRAVPICWIGSTRASTQFVDPVQMLPIRINAGAFADLVPSRDLYVSPDHAMYLDEVLVPAQLLVNGRTITQCDLTFDRLDYYHVEIEPHDLIVAEGAPTESYLDTGNRRHFKQPGGLAVFPTAAVKTWDEACAPLILVGPQLDAIRARLEARIPAGLRVSTTLANAA